MPVKYFMYAKAKANERRTEVLQGCKDVEQTDERNEGNIFDCLFFCTDFFPSFFRSVEGKTFRIFYSFPALLCTSKMLWVPSLNICLEKID